MWRDALLRVLDMRKHVPPDRRSAFGFICYAILSSALVPIVGNDVVPLGGGRTGDKGDDWFGVAHVENFVRHAGFDVNEIAGFVFQDLFQASAEFVADFSFDDVQ